MLSSDRHRGKVFLMREFVADVLADVHAALLAEDDVRRTAFGATQILGHDRLPQRSGFRRGIRHLLPALLFPVTPQGQVVSESNLVARHVGGTDPGELTRLVVQQDCSRDGALKVEVDAVHFARLEG